MLNMSLVTTVKPATVHKEIYSLFLRTNKWRIFVYHWKKSLCRCPQKMRNSILVLPHIYSHHPSLRLSSTPDSKLFHKSSPPQILSHLPDCPLDIDLTVFMDSVLLNGFSRFGFSIRLSFLFVVFVRLNWLLVSFGHTLIKPRLIHWLIADSHFVCFGITHEDGRAVNSQRLPTYSLTIAIATSLQMLISMLSQRAAIFLSFTEIRLHVCRQWERKSSIPITPVEVMTWN